MNPLSLLFIKTFSLPLLFGYGVEGRGFSLYFTNGYSGFCIRVYSIQRYIESGLASEMSQQIISYSYVLFVGIKQGLGCGEMAEWLIAPVLKTGIVLGTIEGSNPSLSFCILNTFVSFYLCFSLFSPLISFFHKKA